MSDTLAKTLPSSAALFAIKRSRSDAYHHANEADFYARYGNHNQARDHVDKSVAAAARATETLSRANPEIDPNHYEQAVEQTRRALIRAEKAQELAGQLV